MRRALSRRELFRPVIGTHALAAPPPLQTAASHLLSRATFGPTAELRALAASSPDAVQGWLAQQLEPEKIDDSAFEAMLPGIVQPFSNAGADIRLLARALFSKRQLAWRMVHFLNNHFSTNRGDTQAISETQEDDAFYKVAFRTFGEALVTSATSPAMIDFLDSQSNVAGNPNENYARELMELHTLGVGGGYTEPDVAQVARVFTGWSRNNVSNGTVFTSSYFNFRSNRHDTGPKSVSFGWSTPGFSGAAGVNEGLSFLAFLAAHPNTATRFVDKLCQYFVADQPPAGLVARVRTTFVSSGGNLKSTVAAIFADPEFATLATGKAKVHDGFELVVAMIRRFGLLAVNFSQLNTRIGTLRCAPHQNPVPTGYPEDGPSWQGAGNLLSRWDFADDLVFDRISGTTIPWATVFGAVPPINGAAWANLLCDRFVDGEVPPTTIVALTVFMDSRLATLPANPTWTQVRPHARALASLVLRLPEAQLH